MAELRIDEISAGDIREAHIGPGGEFFLHRGPGEHDDGPQCWCAPLLWTYEHCKRWPLKAIQQRLDNFFCVH